MKFFLSSLMATVFFIWSPTITAQEVASVVQDSTRAIISTMKSELAQMEQSLQSGQTRLHRKKVERHEAIRVCRALARKLGLPLDPSLKDGFEFKEVPESSHRQNKEASPRLNKGLYYDRLRRPST